MATTKTPTTVSATELARNLSDILNRIQYKGEEFVVERNGKEIARLRALPRQPGPTLGEFLDLIERLPPPDDGFADDLEEIISTRTTSEPPEWPS